MSKQRPLVRHRLVSRPLTPAWMQTSLDLAINGATGVDGRELLDIALRDEGFADEARAKAVELLHPVWINPPAETELFIDWARGRVVEAPDHRPVHLLALMATYPFFTDAAGIVGRLLKTDGQVDAAHVRQRLKARWGDRDAVNVASRKCIQTLRSFGVLAGERGSTLSVAGERFAMQGEWSLWATAALLLGRDVEMIGSGTVETAPELFFLDIRVNGGGDYPLLERMVGGDRRVSYALRGPRGRS